MGLIDQVTGALGGGKGGGTTSVLLQQVVSMLAKPGALGNLTAAFEQQGLGNVLQSWIGGGRNLPISPQQVEQVLGKDTLGDMAQKAGVGAPEAASSLSSLLPQVVDRITPDGKEPSGNDLGDLLSKAGKLFG